MQKFKSHTDGIWGVAFIADGKILAYGSLDATVKLWKLNGRELTTLTGHTAAINL